jgi:hypothetical protein
MSSQPTAIDEMRVATFSTIGDLLHWYLEMFFENLERRQV